MVKRDELIKFINKTIGEGLLEKAVIKDDFANGAQIEGAEKVEKIALGVSVNEEFLQKALEWGSNFCIFHHGIYTPTYKLLYSKSEQKRLRLIFRNNLTIVGHHYALDAHPKIGNNVTIIKKLGAKVGEDIADEWGYMGTFEKSVDIHELAHMCQKLFNHEVFVVASGPEKVKSIAVVSGGYKPRNKDFIEMHKKGVELLITGETSEYLPHQMIEEEINYFVCGHYATETFGVQELGKMIKTNYKGKVDVKFIGVENPI